MNQTINLDDAQLGFSFIELLDFATRADQADDEGRIHLVRLSPLNRSKASHREAYVENLNRVARALDSSYSCYKDMPKGAKSFISKCSLIAKRNKKSVPVKSIPYLQIARDLLKEIKGDSDLF